MAISSMRQIVETVRAKWSVEKVIIQHKLGDCPVGETSVLIAVSSAHRKASLEAVAFAIDDLKANVPIWKKV
jgi:molybdopterin synthase catalytic subunit